MMKEYLGNTDYDHLTENEKIEFYKMQQRKFKQIREKKQKTIDDLKKNVDFYKEDNKSIKAQITILMKQNKMLEIRKEMLKNDKNNKILEEKEKLKTQKYKNPLFRRFYERKDDLSNEKIELVNQIYQIICEQKVIFI